MPRADSPFDWHQLMAEGTPRELPSTRRRLRVLMLLVAVAAGGVWLRAAQLEMSGGARFREVAARPITRSKLVRADRGCILARDGSVLAGDTHARALAVHYRYFEQPADPAWLRRQAAARLSRKARRDKQQLQAMEQTVLAERDENMRRLAQLCGLSDDAWQARCASIQTRVANLAAHVNQRRQERYERAAEQTDAEAAAPDTWLGAVAGALADLFAADAPGLPAPVTLAEQLEYHPLVEDLPADVAAEIAARPAEFPGARVVELAERGYPAGALAAHVVGHLGAAVTESSDSEANVSEDEPRDPQAAVGRMGIERYYEERLRGVPGLDIERLDHRGRSLGVEHRRAPRPGSDVVLTLDPALQRAAEALLDEACRRRSRDAEPAATGGAVVLLDVQSGEVLVSASAPRFDPQWFAPADNARLEGLFAAPNHPLVDRAAKMAIPPGSVFKVVTAVALVENGVCDPEAEFFCQGFLHEPDRQRCLLFRRQGIGHGDLNLAGALAQSCNVYFFHHAGPLGVDGLMNWADRLGFGRPTGIELADEAAGNLPRPTSDQTRVARLAMAQALAIGQGRLEVTPLQVARLMAAVANGGQLVRPRLTLSVGTERSASAGSTSTADAGESPPEHVQLSQPTLQALAEGLRRTVDDAEGTAHDTARLASVAIAGKTGTAQTAGADHAWFAGYAPAEAPRVAFAVVLEHGGQAGRAARLARQLVARMHQRDHFRAADRQANITRD